MVHVYELLQDEYNWYIVSELIRDGELFDILERAEFYLEGHLSEGNVMKVTEQLLEVLNYMHGHQIVHRDLKPENILMENKEKFTIKVTDFGLATHFDKNK